MQAIAAIDPVQMTDHYERKVMHHFDRRSFPPKAELIVLFHRPAIYSPPPAIAGTIVSTFK